MTTGMAAPEDVAGAAVRGAAWMGLEKWVDHLVALAVFVILGRLLSPETFGLVAAADVVILFLRVVVDLGFGRALVQRPALEADVTDTAFWAALGTGALFAVVTFAAAPLVAAAFRQPELAGVVRALSPVLVLAALDSIQSALVERALRFRIQAIRRLVATAASAVVAVALALSGAGVWALVGQALTLEVVTVALLWSMTSWRPRRRFSRPRLRELLAFGSRYSGIRVLSYATMNVDNLLVGLVLGPVALGLYVIAYRVLVVVNELIVLTIDHVALAAFSRLREDPVAMNGAFTRATWTTAAVGFPVYAGLALLASPLIELVFGAKWTGSAPVLQALTLAGIMQCLSAFTHTYAVALGRVDSELRWTAGLTAAQVVAFAVAVQSGITAVALALGIVLVVAWPLRLGMLRRWGGLDVRVLLARLPRLALATAAMALAIVAVIDLSPAGRHSALLPLEALVGVVVYALSLRLVAPAMVRELREAVGRLRGASPT